MGPQDLSFDVEFVQIGQAVAEKHERIHFVTHTRTHIHTHTHAHTHTHTCFDLIELS